MVPELRARGIGEILDAAVALYRARFGRLILVTAAVIVPVQVVAALVLLSAQPARFDPSFTGTPTPVYEASDSAAQLGASFLVIVISAISSAFVVAACSRIVADAYVDHTEATSEAVRRAGRRFFAIIGLATIVALAQTAGVFACFVGIVVPLVFFAVAEPALILEGVGVFKALSRSIELTKSKFGHVLGLVLAAQLLSIVLTGGLTALLSIGLATDNTTVLVALQSVANAIAATITTPFIATATVALYFDLRVRIEGFDIQLMMQRVDARHAGHTAPAATTLSP
jgi:hypothetical protein